MASNHHHHQCHCHPTHPTPPTTTTCHCSICYTTTHYSPPPPDPLFHSTSSHLHHQHHHPPPQPHLHAPPQNHHNLHTQHHDYYPPQKHQRFQKYSQQEDAEENPPPSVNPTVSSLIHRIAALESSLRRRKGSPRSSSLRDAAARTIQTHFRAFLVRRSITLRNLKDLAYIKSTLNKLKSSVSDKTHFDSRILYRESMNLLIKLDSIQGNDPMIRDGKRSISRELIRFMELIDELSIESHVISLKNVRFSKNGKKSVILQQEHKIRASNSILDDHETKSPKNPQKPKNQIKKNIRVSLVPKVEEEEEVEMELENPNLSENRIRVLMNSQPKVKKTVSFSENGNVYRLIKSNHGSVSNDDSDCSNADEIVEEIGVSSKETEAEDDEEDCSEMSDNEMDPRKNLGTRIDHHKTKKNQEDDEDEDEDENDDDDFVFSAPVPAKMEYRVDSSKKQSVKQ